jgi:hypothetical protein
MNYRVLIAAVLLTAVAKANVLEPPPTGWGAMGMGGPYQLPGACELGVDADRAQAGQPNMSIRCDQDVPSFGGLQQSFSSAPYLGKRVRFSGWLQVEGVEDVGDVAGGAGLWIAVPTAERRPYTARLPDQALTGFSSWEYREIVVDVPAEGGPFIVIGFWLEGRGQRWIRDLDIEVVAETVPTNLTVDWDKVLQPNLSLE